MLKDNVVVVTGGAGLLGQEFVKAIIEQNAVAVIADINEDLGDEIKKKLSYDMNTKNIDYVNLDIGSVDSLHNCIDYLHNKYGRVDALVNNAYPRNKNYGRGFFDVEYEDFCENISLNLGGYFLASQQFAKFFKKQEYGNIINISSIYGVISPKFDIYNTTNMTTPIEYSAIKSALIHLTKYMAKYFKGTNIRVNSISPGGIYNNQPVEFLEKYNNYCLSKGMLDKSDLRGTLVYLLSNMSKYLNGQNIVIDDGFTL